MFYSRSFLWRKNRSQPVFDSSLHTPALLHHSLKKALEMAFSSLLKIFSLPVVKADDEDLVDPQVTLRESCQKNSHVEALYNKYQACNDRVNSRSKTTETCFEELMDYVAELDHCVSHDLWRHMK